MLVLLFVWVFLNVCLGMFVFLIEYIGILFFLFSLGAFGAHLLHSYCV